MLVVSRAHHEHLHSIPTADLHAVADLVQRAAITVRAALPCEGVSIRQHDEPAGGQDVWHFQAHVLPRSTDDDLNAAAPLPGFVDPAARARVADLLREHPVRSVP